MTPLLVLVGYLVAVLITFGFGYLWYRTGSGWALFASVGIAIFMNPDNKDIEFVFNAVLTAGFGFGWYFAREKEDSHWLMLPAGFCAMHSLLFAMNSLLLLK